MLLFGLTAVSILIVGFLGVKAVIDSGARTEKTTTDSMQGRVEQFLVEATTAVADKNSAIFNNVQRHATVAAKFTDSVLDGSGNNFSGTSWLFDQQVKRQDGGQYTNSAQELSSVFVQNYIKVTPELKREIELTGYLDTLAPELLKSESNAAAIYYLGTQGETRYYPNIDMGNVVPPDYNPTSDEFYQIATPKNNPEKKVQWSKVYDDPAGVGLLITASHPVYAKGETFKGIIGIDVTLNSIAKNVEDYSPIESSYAILIDNQGRAVAFPQQAYRDILGREQKEKEFGPDLQQVEGDFANILQDMRSGKKDFVTVHANNKDLYAAYAPVEGTDFSLAIIAEKSVMLKVVEDLRSGVRSFTRQVLLSQIIPSAVIILLCVWVLGFIYIRLIAEPITVLTQKIQRVIEGDFSQRITVQSFNEIGKLADAFNKMTRQLSDLYSGLESKVKERTQELNAKVKEISSAKAKDDAILASIGDGIIVTDKNGRVLIVNDLAVHLLRAEKVALVGKPITDYPLYDAKDTSPIAGSHPLQTSLTTGKNIKTEVQVAADDIKSALAVTTTPVLQDGRIIGGIMIVRDITKEKEVDRMKTEFISIASHQLRTPLSAIKWFGDMLAAGDAGKLTPEQTEFVSNISQSTARMIDLVNSLLNISRIESGRIIIDPHPTDLRQLVQGIIDDLKGKTAGKKQTLTVEVDKKLQQVNVDAQLVGQVYLNLLTNAIKYTPEGGVISVDVSIRGDEIISRVSDNGYGIPKSQHHKLFQKFFRAENIVKIEADGTGLGMYLVKAIIESSGGRIWFESEENKGTTFWFSLPRSGMKAKAGEVSIG